MSVTLVDGAGGIGSSVAFNLPCTWALPRTGIDRTRLLGYTLNDTLRLRTGSRPCSASRPGASRPG